MWKLKNKELHETLNTLTNGAFEEELNEKMNGAFVTGDETLSGKENRKALKAGFGTLFLEPISVGDDVEIEVNINASSLKEVRDYDPATWNVWPDTKPPVEVLMRIEVKESDSDLDTPEPCYGKVLGRGCGVWNGYWWRWADGPRVMDINSIIRFRPWEDRR